MARWLKEKGKRSLLASADVYRPAAITQLERVATQAGATFHREPEGTAPVEIAKASLEEARRRGFDFLIFDTAGRLHIDEELMSELRDIRRELRAHQVLLVVDGMTGQEAIRIGKEFAEQIGIDGLVLTKMDGDARGGAALSLREATGKPAASARDGAEVLLETRIDALDLTVLKGGGAAVADWAHEHGFSLSPDAPEILQAAAIAVKAKLKKSDFTLQDFLDQLRSLKKMGPIEDLLKMLPGVPKEALAGVAPDTRRLGKFEAILTSMTALERDRPRVIDGSRRRRIAQGSGTTVTEVNQLLREFEQARTMMKRMRSHPRGLRGLRGLSR